MPLPLAILQRWSPRTAAIGLRESNADTHSLSQDSARIAFCCSIHLGELHLKEINTTPARKRRVPETAAIYGRWNGQPGISSQHAVQAFFNALTPTRSSVRPRRETFSLS